MKTSKNCFLWSMMVCSCKYKLWIWKSISLLQKHLILAFGYGFEQTLWHLAYLVDLTNPSTPPWFVIDFHLKAIRFDFQELHWFHVQIHKTLNGLLIFLYQKIYYIVSILMHELILQCTSSFDAQWNYAPIICIL